MIVVNRAMDTKLKLGEAKDVSAFLQPNGDYLLPPNSFVDGMDYCDARKEKWIWSIGIGKSTGQMWASTTTCFYENPEYDCLWLR